MTSSEIYTFLGQQGAKGCDNIQVDRAYVHPSKRWIFEDFSMAFLNDLRRLGLLTYHPEAWDCDKFAIAARFFASACHAMTNPSSEKGLAFGIWMYTKADNSGGHAVNFAIVYGDDTKPHLVFFEPQTGKEVFLQPAEMIGATYII